MDTALVKTIFIVAVGQNQDKWPPGTYTITLSTTLHPTLYLFNLWQTTLTFKNIQENTFKSF